MKKQPVLFIWSVLLSIQLLVSACSHDDGPYYIQTAEVPAGFTHAEKVELSARVLPHPRQMKWWEDEFKGFLVYGPNTFAGVEWGTGREDPALFNPTGLDTDQWCEVMSTAGMTRTMVVVKHHEGYALWQSRYTDFSMAASPFENGQGDMLRDISRSCAEYGVRLGVYLSPADLHEIERPGGYYGNGSPFTERVIPRPVEGRPFEDRRTFTYELDDYNEFFMNQLFELLTEYGPIYEVWFDGAHPRRGTGQTYNYDAWFDMIRQLAPDAVIAIKGPDVRWCGNEGGATREAEYSVIPLTEAPESLDWPDMTDENIAGRDRITEQTRYLHYHPAETNTSIRHGWYWRNDDEQQVRSVDDVFDIYERSVGGNSIFHLAVPPNTDGRFSDRDVEVLLEVGRLIRTVYGNDLLQGARATDRTLLDGSTDTWWQAPEKQASLEVTLPGPVLVNRFVIREAIAHRGERIEQHTLYARVDGTWTPVAEGKTVGNRRILRFPPVTADAFRLSITESRLPAAVAHISAHYYDEPPKPVVVTRDADGLVSMGVGTSFDWKNHGTMDLSQPVFYTLDGSDPSESSTRYTGPVALPQGGLLRARAIVEGRQGSVSEHRLGIVRAGWTAFDAQGHTEQAVRVLDGNRRSGWISEPSGASGSAPELTIDMGSVFEVAGMEYLPLPGRGFIERYSIEVSANADTWTTVARGTFGNIVNDPSPRLVRFDAPVQARYVRLVRLSPPAAFEQVGAAEIELLAIDALP